MHAGHTIDEIAEMTMQVDEDKRIRAKHALEATAAASAKENGKFNIKSLATLNSNIMDLLSGAAEGTGRTLFSVAPNAVKDAANATGQAMKNTSKVIVGGVATSGKVAGNVALGTLCSDFKGTLTGRN